MLLRHHRQNFKPLYLASLDIRKAFDSVTHTTIIDTMESMGLPQPMVSYIKYIYDGSSTSLKCNGWASKEKIHPTCGVKQGDPLSPIMFNMIMDRMIRLIPSGI